MPPQVSPRKYRIERYLAEGGMGAIYRGKKVGPVGFEKAVVLKQLLPEFTSRPEFRDLFFREAKISATLDHVNIVRTFDLVRSEDALFIVMEYVRGADLRTIGWRARRKRHPLSAAAVIHVAIEILAGLAYAHGRRSARGEPLGIIHRDVSPSNILCSYQGEVKLSDFGIAKAVTYSSAFYRVRGKVGYMSPEQARNQPIDARSDLFSLAVCIYETLMGQRLYTGDLQTPADLIYAQPIPALESMCPGLPRQLEPALRRGLAERADDRYPDAAAFAQALRQVARDSGLTYSGPQLADELARLLGPDPDRWLLDDAPANVVTQGLSEPRQREGKEAQSLVDAEPPSPVTSVLRPQRRTQELPPFVPDPLPVTTPHAVPPPARSPVMAPARRRRFRRQLVLAAAAGLLAGALAMGAVGHSEAVRSLRQKIAFWTG
jgi:serine/threonine protein kinase